MSLFDRIGQAAPAGPQDQMAQLQRDPVGMGRQAGYSIPQQLSGDPKAMVMHLMQTGQVGGAAMQRIAPMIQRLLGR